MKELLTDIDECSSGFARCGLTFICLNNVGSYSCECPPGFRLNANATRCLDINECEQGLHKLVCDALSEGYHLMMGVSLVTRR